MLNGPTLWPDIAMAGSFIVVIAAAVWSRHRAPVARWSMAAIFFAGLTVWAMASTVRPQSIWLNVPIVAGWILGSFWIAGLSTFAQRPLLATAASLAAAVLGLFLGMVVAIELGWLRS